MGIASGCFEYYRETAAKWATSLEAFKASGIDHLELPIPWGAHESLRGARDFSKSPRLRLEKLLMLCQSMNFSVTIRLGFDGGPESVPIWTAADWEIPALIPSHRGAQDTPLRLAVVPSIHDPQFQDSYLSFLAELFGILSLYQAPEGPIERVEFDFGVYEKDAAASSVPAFHEAMKEKYISVETLNLKYRSSFRSFDSMDPVQGIRVLLDRRPWHATYDFKWCRKRLLENVADKIQALPYCDSLRPERSHKSGKAKIPPTAQWIAVVDSLFLEDQRPCTPQGLVVAPAATAFRAWEYLVESAQKNQGAVAQIPCSLTEKPEAWGALLGDKTAVVVCGKFLARGTVQAILVWLQKGGRALFPFGLPQVDENVEPIEWKGSGSRSSNEASSLWSIPVGEGALFIPKQPSPLKDGCWQQFQILVDSIETRGRLQ